MNSRWASVVLLVTAILFIIAMAAQIVIDDNVHPRSVFMYLIWSTLLSGVISTVIDEKINARILV